jgi:hypothetical protein
MRIDNMRSQAFCDTMGMRSTYEASIAMTPARKKSFEEFWFAFLVAMYSLLLTPLLGLGIPSNQANRNLPAGLDFCCSRRLCTVVWSSTSKTIDCSFLGREHTTQKTIGSEGTNRGFFFVEQKFYCQMSQ